MRNFLILLLTTAVCVLGFMVHSLSVTVNTLKQPQKAVDSAPAVPSIELQSRCAKQAEEVFKSWHSSMKSLSDYTSHFNVKLGRCFVDLSGSSLSDNKAYVISSEELLDAFEGREYGSFLSSTPLSGKEVRPPAVCRVTTPSGEEKTCQSSEEFGALAKAYME